MGSRFGGLKQVEPVGPHGETILDYSVYDAGRAGFGKVVFVIRREMDHAFKAGVSARICGQLQVQHVFQELEELPAGYSPPAGRTKPWGTTHAVLVAAEAMKGPFAVINADDFYGAESFRILSQFLQGGSTSHAMVGFVLRKTLSDFGPVSRGLCKVSEDDDLERVVELRDIECIDGHICSLSADGEAALLNGDEAVSMNMWGFAPQMIESLREDFSRFIACNSSDMKAESYLPDAVNRLLATGRARVKVLRTEALWFGVTYREDQPHVAENIRRLIENGSYPERLWP